MIISTTFLLFSYSYPDKIRISNYKLWAMIVLLLLFTLLIFCTNLIIGKSTYTTANVMTWSYGYLWIVFHGYVLFCWSLGIIRLFTSYNQAKTNLEKSKLKYITIGYIIGVFLPIITTVIMPKLGIFDYYLFSPISIFFWVLIMTYTITRHQLFNIKIIAIQLSLFVLWFLILVRILSAHEIHGIISETVTLIVSTILGISLIRSVEIQTVQNEEINRLGKNLKIAHDELEKINKYIDESK